MGQDISRRRGGERQAEPGTKGAGSWPEISFRQNNRGRGVERDLDWSGCSIGGN